MTADKLDPETEARIREACPAAFHDYDSEEPFPSPICTCPIQRAAILADREARSACPGCEAAIDDAAARLVAERSYADALAEMVRGMDALVASYALVAAMHGEAGRLELRALNTKRRDAAKAALAAHDARRK